MIPSASSASVPGPAAARPSELESWQTAEYPADAWRNDPSKLSDSGVPDAQRVSVEALGVTHQTGDLSADTGKSFFERLRGPTDIHMFDIDGRQVQIALPVQADSGTHVPTAEQVAQAIASLPPEARALMERVEFSPHDADPPAYVNGDNAAGTVFISAYDNPVTQRDLDTILLHETAHLIDQPDATAWRAAVYSDGRFATAYAQDDFGIWGSSVTEDFAETVQIYHLVKDTPDGDAMRALYPARFAIIDQMQPPAHGSSESFSTWSLFHGDPGIYVDPPAAPGNEPVGTLDA